MLHAGLIVTLVLVLVLVVYAFWLDRHYNKTIKMIKENHEAAMVEKDRAHLTELREAHDSGWDAGSRYRGLHHKG